MDKPAILGGMPVRDAFLPAFRHCIGEAEIEEVVDTLRSDWITTGPKTHAFEEQFSAYVDCPHAIAVNSCTAGLFLSLLALGIQEGDEVITSPFTFTATANIIVHLRAKPVFADIDAETCNLDPQQLEASITKRTKAIIPVHYAGHPCDMEKILSIAGEYNLRVVEDAAHALGAAYRGKMVGTFGDAASFSFYATKNLATAEGGMVVTPDARLAERIRILSLHGMSRDAWKRYSSQGSWYYAVLYPGYKHNMTDIQASMGIHQLRRFPGMQRARENIARRYDRAFRDLPGIACPHCHEGILHAWHLYPIRIDTEHLNIGRDQFIEALRAENIGTSVHFIPLHLQPYYAETFGYRRGDFPVAERVYERILSLPLYPRMREEDVEDVIAAVTKLATYYHR